MRVLVYSDDSNTRATVMRALGTRVHPDLPEVEYLECATEPVVIAAMDAGGIDLAILDGEAVPAGGMGIARQLKDEITDAPPVVLAIARAADRWLASYAKVEGTIMYPLDPVTTGETVAALLRAYPAIRR